MESQVLTAADFTEAAPAASTDTRPTTEADYPAWETAGDTSLASEAAPSPTSEATSGPVPDSVTPSPSADLSAEPQAPTPPATEQTQPEAERVAALEAQLQHERQYREQREQQERQYIAQQNLARINQEWANFDAGQRQARAQVLARARTMPDAEAERFIAQSMDQLQQHRDAVWAEVTQARDRQTQAAFNHVARQLFAQQVAKDYGLDNVAVAELRKFDPAVLNDDQFSSLIHNLTTNQQLRQRLTQSQREAAAQQRIASGADMMGGLRGGGGSLDSRYDPKSSDYDPALAYEVIGGWSRG